MEAIVGAEFTAWMTLATDGLARQRLEISLHLWTQVFPVVTIGAFVVLAQATLHIVIHHGQAARVAAPGANGIIRSSAALTGLVAFAAGAKVSVLILRADRHTMLLVPHMHTHVTVLCAGPRAGKALRMANLAGLRVELVGAEGEKEED